MALPATVRQVTRLLPLLLVLGCGRACSTGPPEVSLQPPLSEVRTPEPLLTPAMSQALEVLREVMVDHALDPDEPWAIAHGLLALGPDARMLDGTPAIDRLWAFALPVTVGGERLLHFPRSHEGVPVEPHRDLVLKTVVELGFSPDYRVEVQGRAHDLSDLYRHALWRAWQHEEPLETGWEDRAWTLPALAGWAPDGMRYEAVGGPAFDLDGWTLAGARHLAAETAPVRAAAARGEPFVRDGGIHAHPCGGAHLLQGVARAVARGFGGDEARAIVEAEIDPMFHRLRVELAQLDEAMEARPELAMPLLAQRLKFLGHFLESMHTLAALGFYEPDPQQRTALALAGDELAVTVFRLYDARVWQELQSLKATAHGRQAARDLVGDAAHALRGLELAGGLVGVWN